MTPPVVDFRLQQLEKFVERSGPIFEDMRRSLAELVQQGEQYNSLHADFETRLRLVEAQASTSSSFARLAHPIFVSVVSSGLTAAMIYLLSR